MLHISSNQDLSSSNTFRMKVSCSRYIEYDKAEDLAAIDWDNLPKPILHIGGGSNLLFTKDFGGTVLHSGINYLKFVDIGVDEVFIAAGAGLPFDNVCAKACEAGLWGAENLSLIPGEVGGAAVQNVGAYGVEAKDIISGVVCFDTLTRKKLTFKCKDCGYGYRDSIFKKPENKGRYIITSVLFHFTREYSPKTGYSGVSEALGGQAARTPQEVRDAIISIRRKKLPDPAETGSAGSFFKNPVVPAAVFDAIAAKEGTEVPHFTMPGGLVKIPAAWLIDRCGFKGTGKGGAAVYDRQPLVIVNASGEALPEDVLELEDTIISGVRSRFGITLSPEVEHI